MISLHQDMVTLKGRTDVAHIPYQPFWIFIIRCFQLLLALLVMALSAYASSGYAFGGYGLGIFCFVWTLIFLCYIEGTTFWFPASYYPYVHLVKESLAVIFWLSTFASLAHIAAIWDTLDGFDADLQADCNAGYADSATCSDINSLVAQGNATKAAAALGAIEWALFVGTLVTYVMYYRRHHRSNLEANMQGGQRNIVIEEHNIGVIPAQPVYTQFQQPVNTQFQQPVNTQFQQPVNTQAPPDPRYN